MKKMTSRERILAALALKEPDQIPFADDVDPAVRSMIMESEHYGDIEFCRKLGLDAIDYRGKEYWSPLFCKTVIKNGHEFLLDGMIKRESDLHLMVFPDPADDSLYEPIKRFIDKYGNEELATFLYMAWGMDCVISSMGFEAFSEALYDNRKLVENVLDRYTEWNSALVDRLNSVGIDFIITYNNIAFNSGPLFPPQILREIFLPKIKLVADACKIPWVFHSDGNISPILEDLLTLGMNGIHPVDPLSMDLHSIKKRYGKRVCLWGNVDLSYTLTRGSTAEVETEVIRCIKSAGSGGGYILGSANCLPGYVKKDNVLAMAEAAKKYGRYPLDF